jgi:hypothetical protein
VPARFRTQSYDVRSCDFATDNDTAADAQGHTGRLGTQAEVVALEAGHEQPADTQPVVDQNRAQGLRTRRVVTLPWRSTRNTATHSDTLDATRTTAEPTRTTADPMRTTADPTRTTAEPTQIAAQRAPQHQGAAFTVELEQARAQKGRASSERSKRARTGDMAPREVGGPALYCISPGLSVSDDS